MGIEAIAGVAVSVLLAMGGWVWYLSSRLTAADGRITAAKMLVSGATTLERHHPMTEAIGMAYSWSVEQIDGFFRAAALL